jgi:hypothetical protein
MDASENDLVDVFYIRFIRALGNLVIIFAQCESALLELVTELKGGDENEAHKILKTPDAQKTILALIKCSGLQGFQHSELVENVDQYWRDKEIRNRYMHDHWFVSIDFDSEPKQAVPGIRGIPRKKGSTVIFNQPTPDEVWNLARRFKDYDYLFSYTAYALRKAH